MTPLAVLAAALALAAPPPKPIAYSGRITLWVGDKCEHFKPDGGDAVALTVPGNAPYGLKVTPDRKAFVSVDRSAGKPAVVPAGGEVYGKLAVTAFAESDRPFALDGYLAHYYNLILDGSRVFFIGGKGDEVTEAIVKSPAAFVLDVATNTVEPIPLPEKHTLAAVSADGRTYFTTRIDSDNNTYSKKSFLVSAGGKPVEVLKENVFTSYVAFSPDGSKLIMQAVEYTDVQPAGNGGMRVGGTKPREYLVLDTATKTTKPVRNLPTDGYLIGFAWSPDGTQIAYVHYDPRAANQGVVVPAPGGGMMRQVEYEYKVMVSDADGGNAKEVYKTKGNTVRAFMWK